jgi:hypothetical protein
MQAANRNFSLYLEGQQIISEASLNSLRKLRFRFLCFACLFVLPLTPAIAQSLNGMVDIHIHSDPDSVPRSIDGIDVARQARAAGMRGVVLKNHFEPTASVAYLVRKEVPGVEVFGGIVLNRSVGGINPVAVERMALVKGGWGRVVWMPTVDSEEQLRSSHKVGPFVAISKDGKLLPEVKQVIALSARYHLTLETGHSSATEALMLVHEARQEGVEHIVVTHAMIAPTHMTIAQMREAAASGAYLEFVYNALIGSDKQFSVDDYVKAIREVGPQYCILASDLGQPKNPMPVDGLKAFVAALLNKGLTQNDIDLMTKTNPSKALGLQ